MQGTETIERGDLELLRGAVDIHIHHSPDLYNRIQGPVELATSAVAVGMKAFCIKRHNFPTASIAELTQSVVPGVDIFGGLACNREIGGLNPFATEAAIKYGARQIWFPTIDSANHEVVTGAVGEHGKGLQIQGGVSSYGADQKRMRLLDDNDAILPEVQEIIRQTVEADIILNLGHASFLEMTVVAKEAKAIGGQRVICDHPFFLRYSIDQQLALADLGVFINFTSGEILPRWWRASIEDFADAIRKVGAVRSVISTDCGQLHNPPMVEALRMTAQLLIEEGFSRAELVQIMQKNPSDLLYP